MEFAKWCKAANDTVNGHELTVLAAEPNKVKQATKIIAKALPSHYAAPSRVARIMKTLGRPAVADYITTKLPTSKAIRSGDLAEILGVSYLSEFTPYKLGIKRLRWKDHRNMSMRGEDVLAFAIDKSTGDLLVLKGEVKSRVSLTSSAVKDARRALSSNNGRPSAHALSFVADRLLEEGQTKLANMLDAAQLNKRLVQEQVTHLVFTFSANDPTTALRADLQKYNGNFEQMSVGIRVDTHQKFIESVFELASADGV